MLPVSAACGTELAGYSFILFDGKNAIHGGQFHIFHLA